jgi:Family of unknown function (DUF6314)
MRVLEVFNSLKGNWQIFRTINQNIIVRGNASFSEQGTNQFVYREEATVILDQQKMNAYQAYFYSYANEQIDVSNHAGQLMYSLMFEGERSLPFKAYGHHQCHEDVYQATYQFFTHRIQLEYKVNGPKKNYLITTVFDRNVSETKIKW